MAVLNRFYQPARGQYQSQFVPRTLPVDLMAKTLYGKQAVADQRAAEAAKLGEWTQRALENYDTDYVKGIEKELQDFAKESMYTDRTSPEFQRKYMGLVEKIKKDEGLKKVSAAVAKDDAFWARQEELKKKGQNAYADELAADYMYRRGEYTKKGGKGYTGDILLGDENILEGREIFNEGIKIFEHIKDSGSEFYKKLASGIAYKNGMEGITEPRVKAEANRLYEDSWMQTDAGKQDWQRELQKLGFVDTTLNALPAEERAKVVEKVNNASKQNFLDIGLTVVHKKTTTGIAEALNKEWDYNQKKADELAPTLASTEQVALEEAKGATRDKQIKELGNTASSIRKQLYADSKNHTLTPNSRKALEDQLESVNTQKAHLEKAHNKDWQEVKNSVVNTEQGRKASATIANIAKKQATMIAQLKDPELKKLLADAVMQHVNIDDYLKDPSNKYTVANTIQKIRLKNPGAFKEGRENDIFKEILNLQATKDHLATPLDNQVSEKWIDKLYTKGSGDSLAEITSVSTRIDKNSMMEQFKRDIESKPNGYLFKTTDGGKITAKDLQGAGLTFKGASYTKGDAINASNFGINGALTISRYARDSDGEVIINKDGSKKVITKTLYVKAIPQGANE